MACNHMSVKNGLENIVIIFGVEKKTTFESVNCSHILEN